MSLAPAPAVRSRSVLGWRSLCTELEGVLDSPLPVLVYLHGMGGSGKSRLLQRVGAHGEQMGRSVMRVDPADLPGAADLADAELVLVDIDGALTAGSTMDRWLRQQLAPMLSPGVHAFVGCRTPPSPAWRADPGLAAITRFVEVPPLSDDDSLQFLAERGVDRQRSDRILAWAHGNPLALSLAAGGSTGHASVEPSPEVAAELAEHLIDGDPNPSQREALDLVGLVPEITEDLLEATLDRPCSSVFRWLQHQSLVRPANVGLAPHPLAHEVFDHGLRWRNPQRYQLLHDRIRSHLIGRLARARGAEAERVIINLAHLHRDNPEIRPYLTLPPTGHLTTGSLAGDGVDDILTMVEHHEGTAARAQVAALLPRHRRDVIAVHQSDGQLAGFALVVVVGGGKEPDEAKPESDPGLRAARQYLASFAHAHRSRVALHVRSWMSADRHQETGAVQMMLFAAVCRRMLAEPDVRFCFVEVAEPERWAPAFAYIDFDRIPELDFPNGDRRAAVFGHDWQRAKKTTWLAHMRARETDTGVSWHAPDQRPSSSFDDGGIRLAAIDALKNHRRELALQDNPLIHSQIVTSRIGERDDLVRRVAVLQELVVEAVDSLRGSPRDLKLHRAVHHTHIQPCATQEQAAELLGLPFSTYRRHLVAGRNLMARYISSLESDATRRPD